MFCYLFFNVIFCFSESCFAAQCPAVLGVPAEEGDDGIHLEGGVGREPPELQSLETGHVRICVVTRDQYTCNTNVSKYLFLISVFMCDNLVDLVGP